MTLILAFALALGASARAGDEAGAVLNERRYVTLFHLRRSLNANEVVYEAKLTPKGFPESEPVRAYWILKAKGGETEPLTAFEKSMAYGISVESVSPAEAKFTLKALPDRPITVRRTEVDRAVASTEISGKEARIESVFIETTGGGLIPKVRAIEIRGVGLQDGAPRSERFEP